MTALVVFVLHASAMISACGDDGDGGEPTPDSGAPDAGDSGGSDTTTDADNRPDSDTVEPDDDVEEDADDADVPLLPPEEVVCLSCRSDADCGGNGNRCLDNGRDETFCGYDCTADPSVCPADTECLPLGDGTQSQCVPPELVCDNPCVDVECEPGLVCDALDDGECKPPFGLCEPCELNSQCGENNLCVTFADVDRLSACTTSCADDPNSCPEGYVCGGVGAEAIPQCIPEILTCIDRCVGVRCDADEFCDPLNGSCFPVVEPCDACTNDAECGGNGARCLGLEGPPCSTDDDCDASEFCNDGVCFSGRCGIDCLADPFICPEDYTCYNLADGGAQCLPINLACVDRCSAVDCSEGFNCDPITGGCVRSSLDICGQPCLNSAECGDDDDLCINVGAGVYCAYACDEATPCPIGYQCFSTFGTLSHCVPNTETFACDACIDVRCEDGSSCNPVTGRCQADPIGCGTTGTECPTGQLCNIFENRCEPIGLPCTFENRFSACDFNTSLCTAAVEGQSGTCEQDCFGDGSCPADRPACVGYHGIFGSICTQRGTGGADTCGQLMSSNEQLGRPCTPGIDPEDPAVCFSPTANYCLTGVDDAIDGMCTRRCTADADCGSSATCETVPAGQFCIPRTCECMATADLGEGIVDLWRAVTDRAAATPCAIAWSTTVRRSVFEIEVSEDAFRVAAANSVSGEPVRALSVLQNEVRAIRDATATGASAIPAIRAAIAAWQVTVPVNPAPGVDYLENPLYEGLQAFVSAAGGALTDEDVAAEALAVDTGVAIEVGALLNRLAPVLADHRTMYAGFEDLLVNWQSAGSTWAAGTTPWSLLDPRVVTLLTSQPRRTQVLRQGALVAAAAEAFPASFEGAPNVEFSLDTPAGVVVIAGTGDNNHTFTGPVAVLIDLGGNDTYRFAAGANDGPTQAVSLVIDLDGADTYDYVAVAHPDDPAGLPSDGAGRAAAVRGYDGAVSLSNVARQGAGRFGTGALYDLGGGIDTYRSLRYSQGFGLLGTGILVESGAANLTLEAFGQGGGLFGVGILVLGSGEHSVTALHGAQGSGSAGGIGILVGGTENDVYVAEPALEAGDVRLYANRLTGAPGQFSASMGAGVGRQASSRPEEPVFETWVGGGLGMLVEPAGDDSYTAGYAALGAGHWHGLGMFRDFAGSDTYSAEGLGFGAAYQFGAGSFVDASGDDEYGSDELRAELSYGFGEDFAGGTFLDIAGNDTYFVGPFAIGLGQVNGAGIFLEGDGNDTYDAISNDSMGRAALTVIGRDPADNPRRDAITAGFFVDASGTDVYRRPDLAGAGIRNNDDWRQNPTEERGLKVHGAGVDGEGGFPFGW